MSYVFYVKSGISQFPLVKSQFVCCDVSRLAAFLVKRCVCVTVLVVVVVAGCEVYMQVFERPPHESDFASGVERLVGIFVQVCVFEHPARIVEKSPDGISELVVDFLIVCQRYVILVSAADAQSQLAALIGEWRYGVDFYESAHSVSAVERALRPAQYVYALYVVHVEVECRFVYVRDVVYIQSYGRRVDSRAYAPDVYG